MAKRSTKFWIGAALAIVMIGGGLAYAKVRHAVAPEYDLIPATRRNIIREVEVIGRVRAADEVVLAFDVSGRVVRVPAAVGTKMAAGAELVVLDASDLQAERLQRHALLAQVRAELAELRAGKRAEEVEVVAAGVENARRALADAEAVLRETAAKAAVDLEGKYRAVPNAFRDAYAKADDAVRRQTDDLFTNDATSPRITFQTSAYQAAIDTERGRDTMEAVLAVWAAERDALPGDSASRGAALARASDRLRDVAAFLDCAFEAVHGVTNLAQATIATYKANVGTGRTNVQASRTAIEDLRQAIAAQAAANDATLASARADVTAKRNALRQTDAQLVLARARATPEQIQAAEARVAAAALSPIDALRHE